MIKEDDNDTDIMNKSNESEQFNCLKILQLLIASMGVITNIIVVIVFLNDRKLRRKIPNICIINQVRTSCLIFLLSKLQADFHSLLEYTKLMTTVQCIECFCFGDI